MPEIKKHDIPETLRPYQFWGVTFNSYSKGSPEASSDCPFCGRPDKLSIKVESGVWRCLVCNQGSEKGKAIKGGNAVTFARCLWEIANKKDNTEELKTLAKSRGFLSTSILKKWGVVKSFIRNEFLVPGYNKDRLLCNLYRYTNIQGKMRLISAPKPLFTNQIFGLGAWDKSKAQVFICEGPWDGIALSEVLSQCKATEQGLAPTSVATESLFSQANVVSVPGCNNFNDKWAELFSGLDVVIMFDNDHPIKTEDGRIVPPGGYEGAKRVAQILAASKNPPNSISVLLWGEDGYDPSLASGHDLRDFFNASGPTLGHRIRGLEELLGKVVEAPSEWLTDTPENKPESGTAIKECTDYKTLVNAWRKAMKWTDGLDCALSAMLASCASVRLVGDQLWIKVIGPASCGKSTLCEAVSTNKEFVIAKSTMRGFHAGVYSEGEEDKSLISLVKNKTLVTKDGDTLLQAPNLSQILSEARDVYDTVSRTSYRAKGASRDYVGIRMTWILCGTSSLRSIDSSELGERFLDCVIMEGIDDELEDEILTRVAHRTARNMAISHQSGSSQQDEDLTEAMALTGGYISYLRNNDTDLVSQVEVSDEALHYCTRLGKYVAFMRARPSTRQDETAEREFAARLVSQHIRLAICEAMVLNRKSIDEEVLRRTRRIALDTARGKTTDIAQLLYNAEDKGLESKAIATYMSATETEIKTLLRFLKRIGVVEVFVRKSVRGIIGKPTHRLTPRLRKLWAEVHQVGE